MSVKTEEIFVTAEETDAGATGVLHEANGSGDTRHVWNKSNPAEVEIARKVFDTLVEKRYRIYDVNRDGSQGSVIRAFNPEAEAIIASPQTVGG